MREGTGSKRSREGRSMASSGAGGLVAKARLARVEEVQAQEGTCMVKKIELILTV